VQVELKVGFENNQRLDDEAIGKESPMIPVEDTELR